MEMKPVTSSNIKAVGYDTASKILAVEFNNGGLYHYHDVNPSHHAEMMKPDVSTGGYLHKHVKSAHKFTKQ
jgi:KTSC domain